MRQVERFIHVIVVVARIGTGASVLVLIGAVLLQVVGRMTGFQQVWTEELTRFALLYMVAFGVGLAFRTGDLVNVDVFCEALPGRAPWVLRLFAAIVTGGLALYLLPGAWKYASIGQMQTSPALGLRMDFVHVTILLMLVLVVVFAGLRVLGMLAGDEDGLPIKEEEI